MPVTAVVGANWGDEGKGKMTDVLAAESDLVVRFQGGRNAGHTIINDRGKFSLHLLPSGVFYPRVINVLATGVALDAGALLAELDGLEARGIATPQLRISDRAQVVMPYHVLLDECEEERLGAGQFGSTKVGMAPFYADRYAKLGVQVADLFCQDRLRAQLERSLAAKNVLFRHLYARPPIEPAGLMPELQRLGERLRPWVCDTALLLHEALGQGRAPLRGEAMGIGPSCRSAADRPPSMPSPRTSEQDRRPMLSRACIPMPLQIVLDDVGWWSGTDGHERGEPFRTGIGRDHVPADYQAIVQLGRQLGVRPQAAMVLCEWDRHNLLRQVPTSTWMGPAWDNARWVGPWLDEAAAVFADHPEHIELTLHGLGHEYWEGDTFTRAEWYDQERRMRPTDQVRAHLEAYDALLEHNGLGPFPSTFVPAAFLCCYGDGQLSPMLREAGVTFASSPFSTMDRRSEPEYPLMGLDHGVAWVDRGNAHIPWDTVAADPPEVLDGPILGLHWPNILHPDPARNGEVVTRWVECLTGFGQRFDRILARDTAACRTQLAFHLDTQVHLRDGRVHCAFGEFCRVAADAQFPAFSVKVVAPATAVFESPDMDVRGATLEGDCWTVEVVPGQRQETGSLACR